MAHLSSSAADGCNGTTPTPKRASTIAMISRNHWGHSCHAHAGIAKAPARGWPRRMYLFRNMGNRVDVPIAATALPLGGGSDALLAVALAQA